MQPHGTMAVQRELCHPFVERAYAQELLTEEQPAAQVVGGGLRHDAQIGVDRPAYRLAIGEVHFQQVLPYALHCGVRGIDAEGLDVGSQELHALTGTADAHLAHVQVETKLHLQEPSDAWHQRQQPLAVAAHDEVSSTYLP